MTEIPLKPKKRPKYPWNFKITKIAPIPKKMIKIPQKPIKLPKFLPKPKKITEIPSKPIQLSKYP